MIRPVVSVALAVALVGIGTGALAATAPDRASAQLEGEVDRLERAAVELAATSTATERLDRAGRVPVTVTVPDGELATARVERVRIGCPASTPDGACPRWQASYRFRDGEVRTVAVDGPRLRTVGGPLLLGPGEHRLTLAHVRLARGEAEGAEAGSGDAGRPDRRDRTVVVVIERRGD